MAEVAASVGIAEAANAAPHAMSFVDDAGGADSASAILDEVLSGAEPAVAEPAPAEGEPAKPAEAKPADPVVEAPPPNDVEAARLRKGYAKLAEERQKLVELQNTARHATQTAQQYAAKAAKHDELLTSIDTDPAAFLLAHGGEALVQKALQGFIAMEKSPAEREAAKLRADWEADKAANAQRETERSVSAWRNDIIAKVAADERFDLVNTLGLQTSVIDVISGYYEKHSERDDKGNVVKPAILPWDIAAQSVEDTRATMLERSKRYGKRAPAAAETPAKKDATTAKPATAPAKKAPTSLSSVPVADEPSTVDDLPTDDLDARQAKILAEFGL